MPDQNSSFTEAAHRLGSPHIWNGIGRCWPYRPAELR